MRYTCYVYFFFLVFILSSCLSEKTSDPRNQLTKLSTEHKEALSNPNLLNNKNNEINQKDSKDEFEVSLKISQGENPPEWQFVLPRNCESIYWCGIGFKDNCENMNSCRAETESRARADLKTRISVRIRTRSKGRISRLINKDGEKASRSFEREIKESSAVVELKAVKYEHFFWTSENQHMVLARIMRPQEAKIKKDNNRPDTKSKLPVKVTLKKSNTLNEIHKRLINNTILLLEENGISISETVDNSSLKIPFNTLELSISYIINEHKGQFNLFKGLAEIYLSMTAINQKGESIGKKTWTIRRFISNSPDELNERSKLNVIIKTLNKGFLEFENEFDQFFKKYLDIK